MSSPTVSTSQYGVSLTMPPRYEAGHALTVNEAVALNRLFAENASHQIREATQKLCKERGYTPTQMTDTQKTEVEPEFQALFDDAVSKYEFGQGRRGGARLSPVQKAARAITNIMLDKQVEAEGEMSDEQRQELFDQYIKHPQVIKAAEAQVAAEQDRTSSLLESVRG